MNADPKLVCLRLAGNWARKVELDELTLENAWELLLERIAPLAACSVCGCTPCPDPSYCQTMRAADERVAQTRRCEQCGGGGQLDPHKDNERHKIIYLHASCVRFWRSKHQ